MPLPDSNLPSSLGGRLIFGNKEQIDLVNPKKIKKLLPKSKTLKSKKELDPVSHIIAFFGGKEIKNYGKTDT